MERFPRRRFLIATGALLASPAAHTQERGRVRTVGQLHNFRFSPSNASSPYRLHMLAEYERLGWTEGRNIAFRRLYSEGNSDRLPAMARQLVDERVDVIWATTTSSAVAAVRATKTIPIVLVGASAYPVECGLIESFAHPGGNVTGVAFFQGIEVHAKLAELVRELVPAAKRLAWIALPPDLVTVAGGEFRPEAYYRQATRGLGFELGYYECGKVEDFDAAFDAMQAWGAQAAIFEPGGLSSVDALIRIAQLGLQGRIPTFFSTDSNVAAGGLLSYGPDWFAVLGRTVTYVDRILRGARPADLPVEMPNKLHLVINLRTAKAIGVEIPNSILLRADRTIA